MYIASETIQLVNPYYGVSSLLLIHVQHANAKYVQARTKIRLLFGYERLLVEFKTYDYFEFALILF